MTLTRDISAEDIARRSAQIAGDLRADGVPVMGVDAPDMFDMVGITFRVGTGKLVNFRLHYDLATGPTFRALFMVVHDG